MSSVPVIVGAGLAGLSLALSLAPMPVVVIGRKPSSEKTSSELAQGGIAAAMNSDDSPEMHARDTLKAGAGACDKHAVEVITESALVAVQNLVGWGVAFDCDEKGFLRLGLEGAHSRRRIIHANGDSTGAEIMKVLVKKALSEPSITMIDGDVSEIETDDAGMVRAITFYDVKTKSIKRIQTSNVVLATGSAAALWKHTTVPSPSWGSGLWLASKVGAVLSDLEFAQFHPTALDVALDPKPLVSEAVRGEGAVLVNKCGQPFIDPLASRDEVARAVWTQLDAGQGAFLDATSIKGFETRFPTVFASCQAAGIYPETDLIPVRPVTHYHMGGIKTDMDGRSSVKGLWASGECASTGLHGANRLASNSLLEAVVMGQRIADAMRSDLSKKAVLSIENCVDVEPHEDSTEDICRVRDIMARYVGVCRSDKGLRKAIEKLSLLENCRRAEVALLIARAALKRTKSCGAHTRIDMNEKEGRLAS